MVGRYYIQHALLVAYVQNAEVMLNTRASKTWQVFFWERDFILQKREVSNYIFSSTQKPCAASNEFSIKGRIIFIEPASRQSTHGTYMKVYKPHQKRFIHPTVKLKFIDDRGFLIQMKRNMMWNKFCLLIFLWQWWNVSLGTAATAWFHHHVAPGTTTTVIAKLASFMARVTVMTSTVRQLSPSR